MWNFFGKLFKRKKGLSVDEIVSAICQLENEKKVLEEEVKECTQKIDALKQKGKKETSRDAKLCCAKEIKYVTDTQEQSVKRMKFIMYNIKMLNRLKIATENAEFIDRTSKIPLNALLSDQKALAKYLNTALNKQVDAENVLINADEIFNAVEDSYEKNDAIYGTNKEEDALLAVLEEENTVEDEEEIMGEEYKSGAKAKE